MKNLIKLSENILKAAIEMSDETYSVFVEYSPHVEKIGVRIFDNGWKADSVPDYDATIYLTSSNAEERLIYALESVGNRYIQSQTQEVNQ